ncbi:MAG: tryptophan-rich sensory protein [Proteobacteria bacterium]|nr:tryptophan-rich sensory protein [Pseudomonadota bacterium]
MIDWHLIWGWPLIVAGGGFAIVALIGGLATEIGPWYYALKKPSFQPPNWLFGPAWTVIFALIAIAAAQAWVSAPSFDDRHRIVVAFVVNGVLNTLWSILFFKLRRPDWALAEVVLLWLSIVWLIVVAWPVSKAAVLLLLPYILWVSFAAVLNRAIVRLNPEIAAQEKARRT